MTHPPSTFRWDEADRQHVSDGTSVDMFLRAHRLHRRGVTGEAWNVAVLDTTGADVTWENFENLDMGVTR